MMRITPMLSERDPSGDDAPDSPDGSVRNFPMMETRGIGLDIGPLWQRESAPLVDAGLDSDPEVERQTELASAGEDAEALKLHPEALTLYRTANERYRTDAGRYIRINPNNGRRSTLRQAQLYEAHIYYKHYGGPPAPDANRPGKSKHEYGFAIDVIRANDENRLAGALQSAGWCKTVEDEGWHWEAVAAATYDRLQAFITQEMESVTHHWGLTLSSFYERRKERLAILAELETVARQLGTQEREVEGNRVWLVTEFRALATEEESLRRVIGDIQRIDAEIQGLEHERATKRYTYCPNGQVYSECTHTELKQQYDREVRELEQRIKQARARRDAIAGDYDARRKALPERRRRYAERHASWRKGSQAVARLRQEVAKKRTAAAAKERQMQKARQDSGTQLRGIISKVSGWS